MAMTIKWQLALTFEYTPVRTPEMNFLIEKFFDTHFARLRAMINFAHIPNVIKPQVVREGAIQCIQCGNLVLETINDKTATRYEHWSGDFPKYGRCLRVFGELGIVHVKTTATKKLDNRGKRCFFVGNSLQHPANTYRMFDSITGRVTVTQDVVLPRRQGAHHG